MNASLSRRTESYAIKKNKHTHTQSVQSSWEVCMQSIKPHLTHIGRTTANMYI